MSWGGAMTVDKNAGWQEVRVSTADSRPDSAAGWAVWLLRGLLGLLAVALGAVGTFVAVNWLVSAATVPALWALAAGFEWLALGLVLAAGGGAAVWFWLAAESFDIWVVSPLRAWWRRRRYGRKWADLMVAGGLTVLNRRHRRQAPRLARIRQGRFADVLKVRLPDGITAERFAERLPEIRQ